MPSCATATALLGPRFAHTTAAAAVAPVHGRVSQPLDKLASYARARRGGKPPCHTAFDLRLGGAWFRHPNPARGVTMLRAAAEGLARAVVQQRTAALGQGLLPACMHSLAPSTSCPTPQALAWAEQQHQPQQDAPCLPGSSSAACDALDGGGLPWHQAPQLCATPKKKVRREMGVAACMAFCDLHGSPTHSRTPRSSGVQLSLYRRGNRRMWYWLKRKPECAKCR